jgi:hypothetical protein
MVASCNGDQVCKISPIQLFANDFRLFAAPAEMKGHQKICASGRERSAPAEKIIPRCSFSTLVARRFIHCYVANAK